jgi:protease IV
MISVKSRQENPMKRILMLFSTAALCAVVLSGCVSTKNLLGPSSSPLKEYTLQGGGKQKVLLIPLKGVISDERREGFFTSEPSMVEEVAAHLRKAREDRQIMAVVFAIDSPGGTVTASEVLYEEITAFKEQTGKIIVASMGSVAASGGYYVALPVDHIVAHPTTVTGSIGVVFIQPKIGGLMDKIGLSVEVNKSGELKDMGSPFRQSTDEERRIMQDLTDSLARRFLDRVKERRKLGDEALENVSSARVYLADDALALGLVDSVGSLNAAIDKAKGLAGLPPAARVVVYRRSGNPDDTIYNSAAAYRGAGVTAPVQIDIAGPFSALETGFYYLWVPGGTHR